MADQTLVALYDDAGAARQVLDELRAAGLPHDRFWISGNAAGTADLGSSRLTDFVRDFGTPESRVRSLTRLGVPEDDAHLYAEGVRRGGTLLIGEVTNDDVERALAIIERSSPVDLDERGEHYRTAGWSRYDAGADYTVEQAAEERSLYGSGLRSAAAEFREASQVPPGSQREVGSGEEERIPVVEEQINIGKRAVERGGVRVRTYVRETPVEEQVTLREEHVHVERRPVDRAADSLPPDTFQDRTIEVREKAEEAVVSKTARVTEEVVIRKDVEERVETVRDTVQRTEVEVEDTRGGVGSQRSDLPGGTQPQPDLGTDTTPGIGERTREAGHDITADMKENRSMGGRIVDAAHDAKEDLKGNTGTPRRDVER
jgi:uncharacterized protein (TIGR02271 family)